MSSNLDPRLDETFFDEVRRLTNRIRALEISRPDGRIWPLVELTSTPTVPEGADAVFFARDDGAGHTQVCIAYPDGTVTVLDTGP